LQDAANRLASEYKWTESSRKSITINGLQALEVLSSLTEEDPYTGDKMVLKIKSMYLRHGENMYVIHGLAMQADFETSLPDFDFVMYGFRPLKDPSRINVMPEKIKVVQAPKSGTLGQILNALNIPTTRHRELSILNGMDATDPVSQGMRLKIPTRDSGTNP
jgi:predicted Zn-dependent protease